MLRIDIAGETRNWTLKCERRISAVRMVLGGDPWRSAVIYDDYSQVIGRLAKRKDGERLWIDYYRGSECIPAWSKRV